MSTWLTSSFDQAVNQIAALKDLAMLERGDKPPTYPVWLDEHPVGHIRRRTATLKGLNITHRNTIIKDEVLQLGDLNAVLREIANVQKADFSTMSVHKDPMQYQTRLSWMIVDLVSIEQYEEVFDLPDFEPL